MDEKLLSELPPWLTEAGLAGAPEAEIVTRFCDQCVAAGIPLGRAHVFIDTLHPAHEGRLFRWGYGPEEPMMHEYGRTSFEGSDATGAVSLDAQATEVWERSPFHGMLQSGASGMQPGLLNMSQCSHVLPLKASSVKWTRCIHHGGQRRLRDSTMIKWRHLSVSFRTWR
jgi:adenylate cyclase